MACSAFLLSGLLFLVPGQQSADADQEAMEEIRQNLDFYLKRWAEEYVDYIITDVEREVFTSLMTSEEKLAFIETFWRRRDPTLETPENEFRDEYAERFHYANTRFRTVRPGWKTDRGRIYILLGPPTHINRNPLGRISMERPSEAWTYMGLNHPELPSSLDINFVDFRGDGEFEVVSDLDAANLRPAGFLPSFSDLDYFGQRRAYPFEVTAAGEQRVDEGSIVSERFNFLQDLHAAESPPEATPQPLHALVDSDVTFAALPFDLSAQFIRYPAGGGLIPVALAIRYDTLVGRRGSGRWNFSLDVYAELRDQEGHVVDELDQQLNFSLTPDEAQALSAGALRYFFSLSAPPGTYQLHFVVRNNVGDSVGTQEMPVVIPDGAGGLAASSLILADQVERLEPDELQEESQLPSSPFVFAETRVLPNASGVFERGAPMHVYFQVYGLTLREGKNALRVRYTFLRSGQPLWKPAGVQLYPTNQIDRAVSSSFDTEKFPPGRYTMRAEIEDLNSRATKSREVAFLIR